MPTTQITKAERIRRVRHLMVTLEEAKAECLALSATVSTGDFHHVASQIDEILVADGEAGLRQLLGIYEEEARFEALNRDRK